MKLKKPLAAVLLAVLLMAAMLAVPAATASAYTAVTPTGGTFDHSLTLTEDPYELLYTITYTFTVDSDVTAVPAAAASTVTGSPVITGTAVYNSETVFDASHTATQTLTVDWSGVSFSTPGTYYWNVAKTVTDTSELQNPTNNNDVTACLYAFVIDNGTGLEVSALGMATNSSLTEKGLSDTFPADGYQLSLSKTVTGDMGAKDQYFKFTVTLTSPAGSANTELTLGGYDDTDTVNASPYNTGAVQPTSPVTLTGNGAPTTVEVWLKHGQTFTIQYLPHGTTYQIVESANEDYTVSYTVDEGAPQSGSRTTAATLNAAAAVAFTNNKEGTAPTGLTLQTAAPIAGVALVLALGAVLLLSRKRRRNGNAE